MSVKQLLLRAFTRKHQCAGRLCEFSLAGKLGPLLATVIVLGILYLAFGATGPGLLIFVKLCAAYLVPFTALALLAGFKGIDVRWIWILPVATLGIIGGGFASAAVVYRNYLAMLLDIDTVLPEWLLGAAFSAFFIGLSLATTAVRRQEQVESEAQRQVLEARLQTLTARIEPHFLMNTLANLSTLVESDPKAANDILAHLVDLLQAALEQSRNLRSTLGQELKLIESYLLIMQMRLADKLEFAVDTDAECSDVAFPALLLQTLVENAVGHGIEPRGSGRVLVTIERDDANIAVAVTDNGIGFDTGNCVEGTGLQNVRERLDSFYGGAASFAIESEASKGTRARVSFPVAG